MTLVITPRATADLRRLAQYIRSESPAASVAIADRIETMFEHLAQFPATGRKTTRLDVRYVDIGPYPYLIFYRLSSGTVTVLAVYTARAIRGACRQSRFDMPEERAAICFFKIWTGLAGMLVCARNRR